jgi:hypothetical protein
MSKLTERLREEAKAHPLDVDLDYLIVAADEIEQLEAELRHLSDIRAGELRELERTEKELDYWKYKKFSTFGNEECWHYTGEEDNLHSLVCPVVISKEKLLELMEKNDVCSRSRKTR